MITTTYILFILIVSICKILYRARINIAASFSDLTFMESAQLKAELECERKARKKMESVNKSLAREVMEERRRREALERACQDLAKENYSHKSEMCRMKRSEMDDEREMLRTAEVIREELACAEANILLEEKLSEMNISKKTHHQDSSAASLGEKLRFVLGESVAAASDSSFSSSMNLMQRKSCGESSENPHIKRGIKGFVEFPNVVRAFGQQVGVSKGSVEDSAQA